LFFIWGFSSTAQSKNSPDVPGSLRYIKFYPNPATSAINFDFQRSSNTDFTLFIFNFMGKKVFEQKNLPGHTTINLDNFYRGVYIFQLRNKNGLIIESGKFQLIK
jgi:hypothetical protein